MRLCIALNAFKCEFGVSELNFWGNSVDKHGIHPLEDKVKVIRDIPQPQTTRKLREFLWLISLYRKFISHCAAIIHATQQTFYWQSQEFYSNLVE